MKKISFPSSLALLFVIGICYLNPLLLYAQTRPGTDDLNQGLKAFGLGDYSQAMKCYQKAANQGNVYAERNIALLYQCGYGVKQSWEESMKWSKKAAAHWLGTGYVFDFHETPQNCKGIEDYKESMKCFQKSADQGDVVAENFLGITYGNGSGVTQSYQEAVKWFQKAADKGFALAEDNMGLSYEKGYGVTQDYQEAMKWYLKAAAQKNGYADVHIGDIYKNGFGIPRDYQKALLWYRKGVSDGFHAQKRIDDLKKLMAK